MSFEYTEAVLRRLLGEAHHARTKYMQECCSDEDRLAARAQDHDGWISPSPPLLQSDWVAIAVDFALQTPWYSRDDRPFHVLDNPVRRDRVLGLPFMAAASWKGLLRWACRMEHGLYEHLEEQRGSLRAWLEPDDIVHLFGQDLRNATAEGPDEHRKAQRGALAFRPTWFRRGSKAVDRLIGFEVINPHRRDKKAGTVPINYEVVMPGSKGTLDLLYAPAPGQIKGDNVEPLIALDLLLRAAQALLELYGISAKRTAGWGIARIESVTLARRGREVLMKGSAVEARQHLRRWLSEEAGE